MTCKLRWPESIVKFRGLFQKHDIRRVSKPKPKREFVSPEMRLIQSGIFHPAWYRARYSVDSIQSPSDLATHYLTIGWKRGFDPGPLFNNDAYLKTYVDVAEASIPPLLHYLLHGMNEEREVVSSSFGAQPPSSRKESFQDFLRTSLLDPVRHAPFDENTKVALAIMDKMRGQFSLMADRLEYFPSVSVIMPVRNRAAIIGNAIESVLAQTYKNIELIIIDDASVDGLVDVINELSDERIKYIGLPAHVGVSRARNIGIEESSGELICYLDSDNSWHVDYIACMVAVLACEKSAKVAYCGQLIFEQSVDSVSVDLRSLRFSPFNPSLLEHRNYIDINCVIHHRDINNSAQHWFDPTLTRLVDWDFILRISHLNRTISAPLALSNYHLNRNLPSITRDESLSENLIRLRDNESLLYKSKRDSAYFLSKSVSIVVVSFQALEHLKECVSSVLDLNYDQRVELVIVDNASNPEVIAYLRELPPDVKVQFNSKNYGYSYAVHQGVLLANPSSDILLLNNDAILERGALDMLHHAAYREANVGIAVPRQIAPAGHPQSRLHVPYSMDWSECDINLSCHHSNVKEMPLLHDGEILDLSFAPFFCAYIKREIWNGVGGIDYALGRHYRSDRIMCEAIITLLKKRIIYVAGARVWHAVQASTEALLAIGGQDQHKEMLLKNYWTQELCDELGIERKDWDV